MNIDAIRNGIVIDHITAGKAMQVYNMLNLDKLDCQVAIIRNAASTRTGTKDIIKIARKNTVLYREELQTKNEEKLPDMQI